MNRLVPIGLAVLLLAAAAMPAAAQRRARRAPAPVVVSAPPGTQVIQVPAQSGSIPAGANTVNPGVATTQVVAGTGASVETLLNGNLPVPGLGFDYVHHAAVNRHLAVQALVDPVTQQRLALARQIRRETPVAALGPVIFNSTQVIVVPSPPVIILQQQPAEPEEPFLERIRYTEPAPAPVAAEPPPPPRELDELVLVRRDGAVVYAVAFLQQRDRILYITREGRRHSLSLAELDLDATLQQNEDRGTTLRLTL